MNAYAYGSVYDISLFRIHAPNDTRSRIRLNISIYSGIHAKLWASSHNCQHQPLAALSAAAPTPSLISSALNALDACFAEALLSVVHGCSHLPQSLDLAASDCCLRFTCTDESCYCLFTCYFPLLCIQRRNAFHNGDT